MQHMDFFALSTLFILMTAQQRGTRFVSSLQIQHQSTRKQNEMPHKKIDKLEILKDQTTIVRLPSNPLLKYNSYKDVSILHFRVSPDTRRAVFTFEAIEESKGTFQHKCEPRDITLHLKANSYPVISPENITFPKNFLSAEQRFKIYNLQFLSDEVQHRIIVDGPQVGNWFAVAFVSWTDPNNDRIKQQGLTATCDTLLLAEMSASSFLPIIISNGQAHKSTLKSNRDKQYTTTSSKGNSNVKNMIQTAEKLQKHKNQEAHRLQELNVKDLNNLSLSEADRNTATTRASETQAEVRKLSAITTLKNNSASTTTNNEVIYKFYIPQLIGVATACITFDTVCPHCPDVGFYIQANALPNTEAENENGDKSNYIYSTIINPNQTEELSIEFYVQPMTWHYALIKFVNKTGSIVNSIIDRIPPDAKQNEQAWLSSEFLQSPMTPGESTEKAHLPAGNDTTTSFVLRINYHELSADNPDILAEESKNENKDIETNVENNENNTLSNATTQTRKSTNAWNPKNFRGIELYPVLRQTYHEFFTYDYDFLPDENGTVPMVLNLTTGIPAGFSFDVGDVYDIGGTLSFAVSIKHNGKVSGKETTKAMPDISSTSERTGILAEKLIENFNINAGNEDKIENSSRKSNIKHFPSSNQTIIICMHFGEPGVPKWPDKCRYGRRLLPASSVVNNTDLNTSTGLIHVPFPESGQWYVTMGLYCNGAETRSRAAIIDSIKEFVKKYVHMLQYMRQPCACTLKLTGYRDCINDPLCFTAMNETETLKIKECLMDIKCTPNHLEMTQKFQVHQKLATEQLFSLDNCSTSVVFTISSSPCVAGKCGRYGRCHHYMSGGFVFSTCVCMKGYRGWDCAEDSQVSSSLSILTASLLLTLSNLLFLPSICIAGYRQFYTEAVIYFFAMFFSVFYHACDSGEDEYSFCLVKMGVLQFCDFYCGLLAIWVTLIAMSHIRQQFVSLLHMVGAILLAFGTELNKQSLWVFLTPALTGICLISASWGIGYCKSRKLFPTRIYLTVYMPLGTILVVVGFCCYAFFQTKNNYHIVHSVWHMVMALSILCLLPSSKSFIPKC